MLFGISENTWLIIALVFLGVSGIQFLWVWWSGFIRDQKSEKKIEFPWE